MEMRLEALPITVLMNGSSGSGDKRSARDLIERTLAESKRDFELWIARRPAQLPQLARDAVARAQCAPRILVGAGGDGTLNAVVGAVAGSEVPLGVIPLGTFNYWARNLGIPTDPEAAVRALLHGRLQRLDVARINGQVFLNNTSFGLYRRLLEERERAKRRFGRYRAVAVAAALITLLRRHRSYDVAVQLDGRSVALRTQTIFFGFNALQLARLDPQLAACAERGSLAVLALPAMSRLERLRFALRSALRGLEDRGDLPCFCASSVEVRWRGAPSIRVAVDGESRTCALPLRVDVLRGAVSVLVPRDPAPRT